MRFEPRQTFASGRPVRVRRSSRQLPIDLAFLERFGVPHATLAAAAARAASEGVDGFRALIAENAVSETLYYHALASHLALPFVDTWPRLAEPVDPREAVLRGRLRLTGGPRAWLVAPEASAIRTLLAAKALGTPAPDMAITTPSHLAAILCHRSAARIAWRASRALPRVAPRLSACRAPTPSTVAAIGVGIAALLLGIVYGSHLESDVLGVLFLAALVFRLMVFGEGLERDTGGRLDIADRSLPTYSVLVPLRDEAGMVADLVAALVALDYPA